MPQHPWVGGTKTGRRSKSGPASLFMPGTFRSPRESMDQEKEESLLQWECFLGPFPPSLGLCRATCERRAKPLRPPMRPLCSLDICTQYSVRHLASCPIIAVIGGPAVNPGSAGATAIELGHIMRKEHLPPHFGAVFGERSRAATPAA